MSVASSTISSSHDQVLTVSTKSQAPQGTKEEEKVMIPKIFHPHYVVLITDETLIGPCHYEFFREDPTGDAPLSM